MRDWDCQLIGCQFASGVNRMVIKLIGSKQPELAPLDTLSRPAVIFPLNGSTSAFHHWQIIIATLTHGGLYGEIGWWDGKNPQESVPWHRCGTGLDVSISVGLIACIYGLWMNHFLEIEYACQNDILNIYLKYNNRSCPKMLPLEQEVLRVLAEWHQIRPVDLVTELQMGPRVRGLKALLYSWENDLTIADKALFPLSPGSASERIPCALDVAKGLVAIKIGCNEPNFIMRAGERFLDELEYDGIVLDDIDCDIFAAVHGLK